MAARPPLAALSLTLVGTSLLACTGTTGPGDDLTERLETERFVFLHAPGDAVDTRWQERYQGFLEESLGLRLDRKIEYRKYRDPAHKARLTGRDGNAYAEPAAFRIHTIWPRDDHEVVHVLVNGLVGEGPALFGEGVAVAHQIDPDRGDGVARWSGTPVHDLSRSFLEAGTLPPLDDLVTSSGFRGYPDAITYPAAGSFVRFLLDRRGTAPLWELLRATGSDDGAESIRAAFLTAYGISLDRAWSDWMGFLGTS